jgi:hypothetical protein
MSRSQARAAWIAIFSIAAGSALAAATGLLVNGASPGAVAIAWFIGASASATWVWSDHVKPNEFRFTSEGWSVLGWLAAVLFPPLGVVIGMVLRTRGSTQGIPMIAASLALFAVYAVAATLL